MHHLIESALETFPNFVIVDEKGIVVYLNEGYANLLGVRKDDAIGRPVDTVIPDTKLRQILSNGQEEIGSVMKLFDHVTQQEISVVCNRIPIKEDGRVIGALAATTINNIFDVAKLHAEIEKIKKENSKFKKKLAEIQQAVNPLDRIIGNSAAIQAIKKTISEYADSNLTILITGETGVGKEVFAKAIHQCSDRSLNNYVKINCAAIPDTLLESELFGYESGAFTGASKNGKPGKFELANKGTLLLDEIGEMPLGLQAKLLRVLQEKEFEKVGGVITLPFTARLICCTNQTIEDMVEDKTFRQDLYYRINIVEIAVPPLRERLDDIEPLCYHFLRRINLDHGLQIESIENEVFQLFYQHSWPGNVRELEHVIERASVTCKDTILKKANFTFFIDKNSKKMRSESNQEQDTPDDQYFLRSQTEKAERDAIIQALRQASGNKTKAAQILHIDRSRLYSKLKKYNID